MYLYITLSILNVYVLCVHGAIIYRLTILFCSSTLQVLSAPVVQWIEQARPKGWMYVRFVPGAHVSCETNRQYTDRLKMGP